MSSELDHAAASPPPAKRQRQRHNSRASLNKPSSSTPPLGKFLASSDKSTRDKAVASLSRFLSAGRLNHLGPLASATNADGQREHEEEEEELPAGELNWDDEYEVDARLQPLEMAKLWKGVYYCAFTPV
ncbi:hypothetical protein JCM3774_002352 [Rhodotorula dairenensis]